MIDNHHFLGHIANDTVKDHSTKDIYNEISEIKNNAIFDEFEDKIVFLTAKRNIKKDEEILVAYNYGYWIDYTDYINL